MRGRDTPVRAFDPHASGNGACCLPARAVELLHTGNIPLWTGPRSNTASGFHHLGICLEALPLKMGLAIDGRSANADLSPGSVCLMPAGASFQSSWDREATLACLYFTPESLREVAGEEYAATNQEFFPRICLHSPAVSHLIRTLHQDARRGHPFGKMLGDSIFVAVAASLMQDGRVTWKRTYPSGVGDRRVRAALEYIHCNFSQPVSILGIAQAAETSPFHLTRSFKAATGESLWHMSCGKDCCSRKD